MLLGTWSLIDGEAMQEITDVFCGLWDNCLSYSRADQLIGVDRSFGRPFLLFAKIPQLYHTERVWL
jgi:hypothetical protein